MGAPKSCENLNLNFLDTIFGTVAISLPPPPRYATDPTLTLDLQKSTKKNKLTILTFLNL